MKIQRKIFLLFGGLVFASIVLILAGTSFQVRRNLKNVLINDLIGVNKTLIEYEKARLELLRTKTALLAEEPRLKAALDTGDPATVAQEAEKFVTMIDTDIMILTDPEGKVLANIGDSLRLPLENWDMLQKALSLEPGDGIGKIGQTFYHILSSPVVILQPNGFPALLGTVSIGIKIDETFLANLESMTDCRVAFGSGVRGDAASFVPANPDFGLSELDRQKIEQALSSPTVVHELELAGEKQLVLFSPYLAESNTYFLLMRSLDTALAPILRPTMQFLLLVGLVTLLVTLLISYVISRGISTPITSLLDAISLVGKGNLDQPVQSSGSDEIGRLGTAFEKMRLSLKENIANLEKTYSRLVVSEKLATTGKLLAHLSHELNNPIHNIRSALETVLSKTGDPSTKGTVEIAYEEIKRLQKLVHQTLNFYRPGDKDKQPTNINEILNDILSLSERTFTQKGITVEKRLQNVLPDAPCNSDQIRQVLLNLILNAQEAMPGGGRLLVSSYSNDKWITVEVEDTGPGIPPENQSRIFDAFFTTKSQVSGVGLGLSVSYEIMQQHGGELLLDSTYQNGARFIARLPRSQELKNESN